MPALKGVGLLKGLGVTLKTMTRPAATRQYPHVKPDLPARTRGVIALIEENCTVCMLCARECPDWCIYIDSHKEQVAPKEGGRARTRNILDRFAIDFALCMYCGICVEVCPFDALHWSPEFEYATSQVETLTHEMDTLRTWAYTVPAPDPLEEGAVEPKEVESARKAREAVAAKAAAAAEQAAAARRPRLRPPPRPPRGPAPTAGAAPAAAPTGGAPARQMGRGPGRPRLPPARPTWRSSRASTRPPTTACWPPASPTARPGPRPRPPTCAGPRPRPAPPRPPGLPGPPRPPPHRPRPPPQPATAGRRRPPRRRRLPRGGVGGDPGGGRGRARDGSGGAVGGRDPGGGRAGRRRPRPGGALARGRPDRRGHGRGRGPWARPPPRPTPSTWRSRSTRRPTTG